jgi:RHS repeat-associated protein
MQIIVFHTQLRKGHDQILADETASGEVLWPLTDHQGTVRDLLSTSGAPINHLIYDSFGRIVGQTNPAVQHLFAYTGREFDHETDQYFYRARYYDPAMGQFISSDPTEFASGDTNIASYVSNNPVNNIDPSGLQVDDTREALKGLFSIVIEEIPKAGTTYAIVNKVVELAGTFKNAKDPQQMIEFFRLFQGSLGRTIDVTKSALIEFFNFVDNLANIGGWLTKGAIDKGVIDELAKKLSASTKNPNNAVKVRAVSTAIEIQIANLELQHVDSQLTTCATENQKQQLKVQQKQLQDRIKKLNEDLKNLLDTK